MGAGAGVKTGIKIGGEILDSGRRFLGETLDYASHIFVTSQQRAIVIV
jgi:hypothetical protein